MGFSEIEEMQGCGPDSKHQGRSQDVFSWPLGIIKPRFQAECYH